MALAEPKRAKKSARSTNKFMNTRTALILLAIGAAYVANPMPSFAQARAGGGNSANVGGLNGGGGVGGVNGVISGSSSVGGLEGGDGTGGTTGVGGVRLGGVGGGAGIGGAGVGGAGVTGGNQ
jgi:hypothetical protein